MSTNSDGSQEEESGAESLELSWHGSSSSESEEEHEDVAAVCKDIDVTSRKGADVLLHIHDQLDLSRLQQMKHVFFADEKPGALPELDMKQFSDALRSVLPDTDDMSDEDLGDLFMKIDANGSGEVDWDEFTGFLLQLDEGNRNMAAAAHMVDLRPLPGRVTSQRHKSKAGYHRDMIEKVINIERPAISAYVTCGRDGTIRFWHKTTFALLRSIRHLDTIKANCASLIMGPKGWDVEGGTRSVFFAPGRKMMNSMKNAWVCDIQQMPLTNRIAAACLDRTVSFYDILTGEFACQIAGLRSSPTCVECIQVVSGEQQVLFGDLDGLLHVWTLGKHFHIPGFQDTREAVDLKGNCSMQAHSGAVSCMAYVADLNAAVTCGVDGKVHFIDLVKRRVLRTFGGHVDGTVFSFAYCVRHRFVASAGMGREVVFWNPYTMDILARGDGHAANVKHCLIDEHSGRVITVSADKTVRCWDSTTFRCIQIFKDNRMHRPDDTVTAAIWDESRSSLILAGNTLGVWKNKGAIQVSTRTHEAPVTTALYNTHFHQVVSGDAMGNIHVWQVETGHLAFRFGGAHGASKISCMCFDASERRLLTGANDGGVKMWNFSSGKELQAFGYEARQGGQATEGTEVSGLAYCRDDKGSDQEGIDYVATCSWDKQVRVYTMDTKEQTEIAFQPPGGGEAHVTAPSRVFPGEIKLNRERGIARGGGRHGGGPGGAEEEGSREGHSADILAIVHCGHQQDRYEDSEATPAMDQAAPLLYCPRHLVLNPGLLKVATGGVDGCVFVWAADSGKVKFIVKPSDHDISEVDEVSSIGGLTSAAPLMQRQRKQGLMTEDGNSAHSVGYLDRMDYLLAEDPPPSGTLWDGRQYFAKERMGGSDDGSGTAVAAKDVAYSKEEAGSARGCPTEGANSSDQTAQVTAVGKTPGQMAGGETANDQMTGVPQHKLSADLGDKSPIQSAAPANGSHMPAGEHDDSDRVEMCVETNGAATPSKTGSGGGLSNMSASRSALPYDGARVITTRKGEPQVTISKKKDPKENTERQEKNRTKGTPSDDPKSGPVPNHSTDQGKENVVAELFDRGIPHTVDCLIYINCHDALVSGTASGQLHIWDAPTGAFIYGTSARHPNDTGMSAMGTSENGGNGAGRNAEIGGTGITFAAATAAAATPTAAAATAPSIIGNELRLYTACEEGFVKTWKVGDIAEYAYQTGMRVRPKKDQKSSLGRRGKGQKPAAGEVSFPGGRGGGDQIVPLNTDGAYRGMKKSLLQPLKQWQAHETTITSVDGASFHGKLDLLVTAGVDCYIHLWTAAGAHIGAFGQPTGLWSLGSRATWREPTEQALLGARKAQGEASDESNTATNVTTNDGESRTTQRESQRVRQTESRSGVPTMGREGGDGGDKIPRKSSPERPARIAQDRDIAYEREEAETRQEKRYYAASQNRVQRKLLRARLSAFCMSREYCAKDQLQEACNILGETAKRSSFHPMGNSARPGLSKPRITAILRNTYNQVSFQLQLHKHEDVHDKVEATLTRRKARRRAKNTNAGNIQQQNHRRSGSPSAHTPASIPSFPAVEAIPTARIPELTDGGDCGGAKRDTSMEVGQARYALSYGDGGAGQDSSGVVRGSRAPAAGTNEAIAFSSAYRGGEDGESGSRPAVPIPPPSSAPSSGRRFRRPSATE